MASRDAAAERLLDRDEELTAVAAALDAAQGDTGTLLVIEGGAGIGKTRLLASAVDLGADRGMRCLSASSGEFEGDLPFGVVRQLFEPLLASAGPSERERLLEGAAGLATPAVEPEADPTEAPATFATLHGLYWLTANLAAEQPLLLAVDDAHWADAASVRYLVYLARRLEGLPVLVAPTVRTGAPASGDELVDALMSVEHARVLRPRPLGEAAVAALIDEGLGEAPEPAFSRACHAATGGNPFLARELVLDLAERSVVPVGAEASGVAVIAPDGVARNVLVRLGRLPEGAAKLARAVAVLGDNADLTTAAHVADVEPDEGARLVDALVGVGLLERGVPLRFVHPLVRSAIAGALGPGALDSAHRRAAAVLAERGDRGDLVAAHLAATRPAGEAWVVDALVSAAGRATARGAPDVAGTYLRRALAEPPPQAARQDVLLELGAAEVRAADPRSIEHLEQARDDASEPLERGRAALLLGRALAAFGRFPQPVAVYERGLAELGDEDPGLRLELEAELLGAAPLGLSTRVIALERAAEIEAGLAPDSPAACKLLASLAREEMARLGPRDHVIGLAERSLSSGFLMADEPLLTFPWAPLVLMYAGEIERAVQVYDEALARSRERGAVLSASVIGLLRGRAVHMRGQLADAAADTREALDAAEAHDARQIVSYAGVFLAWTLIAQGELADADAMLQRVGEPAAGESFTSVNALRVRGSLRLGQDRVEEAAADLRECGRRLEAWKVRNPALATWRGELALAEQRVDRGDEARALAAEQLELAREWPSPWLLAQSLRSAGTVTGGDEGEALLREAAEVGAAGGARLEEARALVELGALLRRSGARKASREPLREGLDLALTCGAQPVAERAHEELVASGAQPRRLRQSGPDALTPAERRVAGMALEGMTNRAIAQALFVSEKTVETHMRSVFRKLDIASRSQLGTALMR